MLSLRLWPFLQAWGADGRFALRRLARTPMFSAATLLTLALCLGANTALFSIVHPLLLKAPPFPEPGRLVEIFNSFPKGGLRKGPSNIAQYLEYRDSAQAFASVGLWVAYEATLGRDGPAERVYAAKATADLFPTLGLQPVLGNFFTPEDSEPGADNVVVVTEAFWRARFAARDDVLGQTIRLDGETLTIVGVASRAIRTLDARVQLIRPLPLVPALRVPSRRFGLRETLYGRLKPGVTAGEAQAEADRIEAIAFSRAAPAERALVERTGHQVQVVDFQTERSRPFRNALLLLEGGAWFVLLIGCANVANLLLARATMRQAELAVRVSLGANRLALARQLLVETFWLVAAGMIFGLGCAAGIVRVVNEQTANILPAVEAFALNAPALAYSGAVSLLAGLALGLVPVVHVWRSDLSTLVHSQRTSCAPAARKWGGLLVAGQSAIALVLLVGAKLLVRSLDKALAVESGLQPEHVVTARVAVPEAYRSGRAAIPFQERLVQALERLPGVAAVGLSFEKPFAGGLAVNAILLGDQEEQNASAQPAAYRVVVSAGYATAVGLQVVEGRFFEPADFSPGRRGFVVDEAFAKKYFPNRSAVGARLEFAQGAPGGEWPTILGVVRNVPHNGVEDRSGIPFIYQMMRTGGPALTLFMRTSRTLASIVPVVRQTLREIDPGIALFETGDLQSVIDASYQRRRAIMLLLSGYAGLALFLSALGLYAMLAFEVSQRTHEIGIRGAIGATPSQLVALVLGRGLGRVAIGLGVGAMGALALGRFLTSMLYDISPADPHSYAVASVSIGVVAIIASYLPARRAARINPVAVLQRE